MKKLRAFTETLDRFAQLIAYANKMHDGKGDDKYTTEGVNLRYVVNTTIFDSGLQAVLRDAFMVSEAGGYRYYFPLKKSALNKSVKSALHNALDANNIPLPRPDGKATEFAYLFEFDSEFIEI